MVVRHDDDAAVAFGPAQRSQANTRAPGRAFHHRPPLLQLPGCLGLFDHARGDSVLAGTARVEVLHLLMRHQGGMETRSSSSGAKWKHEGGACSAGVWGVPMVLLSAFFGTRRWRTDTGRIGNLW